MDELLCDVANWYSEQYETHLPSERQLASRVNALHERATCRADVQLLAELRQVEPDVHVAWLAHHVDSLHQRVERRHPQWHKYTRERLALAITACLDELA